VLTDTSIRNEKNVGIKIKEVLALIFCSKTATVSLCIVLFWILSSIFAFFLTPYSPTEQDWRHPNEGPSWSHPLGTDDLGRDLWARILYGGRIIFAIFPLTEAITLPGGIVAWGVCLSLIFGCVIGLISGYFRGWVDELLMRLVDAWLSLPYILFYLIIMVALGPSALNVVIALVIHGTPNIARLVRGLTLDISTKEYVKAAETGGE